MGKKLTSLNRYISVIADIDEKWFIVFERTVNHLFLGYVCSPQLQYTIFLVLHLVSYFFSSSSYAAISTVLLNG